MLDDFLHAGDEHFDNVLDSLRRRFVAGKIEESKFNYIGFRITQDTRGVVLDHSAYIDKVQNKGIDPKIATEKHEKLTSLEQTGYRQLVGQLNWAVQGSRPDMAFELLDLSTKLKEATVCDLSRAIQSINRLKDIKSVICFQI